MIKEFKAFILQGNVIDLIIGFTVGVGFKDAISSFVDNIVTPIAAIIIGDTAFNDLYLSLNGESYISIEAARQASAPILTYGVFLSEVIDLLIIGFTVFITLYTLKKFGLIAYAFKKSEN